MSVRMLCNILMVFCTFASILKSADIAGPERVDAQKTVKLSVSDLPDKAKPKWILEPLDGQDIKKIEWITDSRIKDIQWIGPLGRYKVTVKWAYVEKDGSIDFDEASRTITLGDAPPDNPLVARFKKAYDSCDDKNPTWLNQLGELHKSAANSLRNEKMTYKELYDSMSTVAKNKGFSQKMLNLQKDIQAYMTSKGYPATVTDNQIENQAGIAKEFDLIGNALVSIK